MKNEREHLAMKVSVHTIIGNVLLSAFKLFAGIFANSGAMLSDAVHSISDVISTVVVMVGIKVAGKSADKEHPYGHERLECVAAILLAMLLAVTGFGIGIAGIQVLLAGNYENLKTPGILALIAAVVSIVVKEAMYWYTRWAAKKIGSDAMMADAWHHRSDALSSVGSFIGILGARIALPVLDPIASIVICIFIVKAAIDIFRDAVGKMTDHACDDETADQFRTVIEQQDGVMGIDQMKTRLFGDRIYLDVEIKADNHLSLEEAHGIAHQVHDTIESEFEKVKHCMVHVNPQQ